MSNAPNNPYQAELTPGNRPKKKSKGAQIRLAVLSVILVLAFGGLAYDFAVARPQSQAAFKRVGAMLADESRTVTSEDVQKEVGFAPKKEDKGYYTLETYSWNRGLPFMTYRIYVVYEGKDVLVLRTVSLNRPPEVSELPAPPAGK